MENPVLSRVRPATFGVFLGVFGTGISAGFIYGSCVDKFSREAFQATDLISPPDFSPNQTKLGIWTYDCSLRAWQATGEDFIGEAASALPYRGAIFRSSGRKGRPKRRQGEQLFFSLTNQNLILMPPRRPTELPKSISASRLPSVCV